MTPEHDALMRKIDAAIAAENARPEAVIISDDEWESRFQPTGDSQAGPLDDLPAGVDPACIWTVIDDEDGGVTIASGPRIFNRSGYYICEVPVPPGEVYETEHHHSDNEGDV